jgi:DNA replication protein DnaC
VEVLVLDDLGASKPSAWVLDIIGLVLNARYNERRVTILTTNYFDEAPSAEPVPRALGGQRVVVREDAIADRIGARMRSRLYEMCRTVEVFAPDFRREVRQTGRARA